MSRADFLRRLHELEQYDERVSVEYRVWVEGVLVEERTRDGRRVYPWPDLGTKDPIDRVVHVT